MCAILFICCLHISKKTLNIADEIVINQQRVGRFKIFKLADVGNWEIILSEDMAQALKTQDFRGVHIYEINS